MKWLEINYEAQDTVVHEETKELFAGDLSDRERELGLYRRRKGPLVKADVDWAGWGHYRIYNDHIRILKRLKAVYRHDIFSFAEALKVVIPPRHHRKLARRLSVLWTHGYLEKWVAGEFANGLPEYAGELRTVGKYHGVHYRVVEDKEEWKSWFKK